MATKKTAISFAVAILVVFFSGVFPANASSVEPLAKAVALEVHGSLNGSELVVNQIVSSATNGESKSLLGPLSIDPILNDFSVLEAKTSVKQGSHTALARVAHASLLIQAGKPLIEAEAVAAASSASCKSGKANLNSNGTGLLKLVVNGQEIASQPEPNTTIPLTYTGDPQNSDDDAEVKLILNEQHRTANFLYVTMIHVIVTLPNHLVAVDIKVSQAITSIVCKKHVVKPPVPTPTKKVLPVTGVANTGPFETSLAIMLIIFAIVCAKVIRKSS